MRQILIGFVFMSISCFALATNTTWKNWFGTESVTPGKIATPADAKQLVVEVKKASSQKQRVRMTGSGHAMSDAAITSDVLLLPDRLNKPLQMDCARLRAGCESSLVRFQSGIQISELNKYLDRNGRALLNMGGYDGQTFAGAMMTSTHGSGLHYGPLADAVVSLQIVVEDGRMLQIEPKNGISDPDHWKSELEEDATIPIQLIQDDDAFNAVRVSIGSMGVVYSVVLKTDRKFWLRESRHLISWSELKKPGGFLDQAIMGLPVYGSEKPSPEHWELQYSPYKNKKGDHTFLITDRYRSYTPLPEQSSSRRGQFATDFVSNLIVLFGAPIAQIMDLVPRLSKPLLESALKAEVGEFTNVSYKVFNIGAINNTPALGMEMAFDIQQTKAAIERSFTVAEELLSQGIPQTSPIAIRFVKQSSALISMTHDRDSSFMEVIVLRDGKNSKKLIERHQKTYLSEFKARPHWGLDLNTIKSEEVLRQLYPSSWDRWKTQFRKFNQNGTFDGKITDRLKVSIHPRISREPLSLPPTTLSTNTNLGRFEPTELTATEKKATLTKRRQALHEYLAVVEDEVSKLKNLKPMDSSNEKKAKEAELQLTLQIKEKVLKRNSDLQ